MTSAVRKTPFRKKIDESPARERIFNAALRLLRKGGVEEATMRAVCERAEVTPPTLYHHFGDMKGLYLAVVENIVDEMRGEGSATEGLTPFERINDTWAAHVRIAQLEPGLFDLWNRHLAWDKLSETSLHSYHALVEAFETLAAKHPLKVEAKVAAYTYWGAAHGMACLIAASQHDGIAYPKGAEASLKKGVLDGIFKKNPF